MRRLRTALVGCGKVGGIHAKALAELPSSEFVAVCDADLARASDFARRYGLEAYDGVEAMLSGSGVEALFVATPHPLHAAAAIPALERGVHVLVEKPLAASLSDCDAMLLAARKGSAVLSVVSQRRFMVPVVRMRRAIEEGKIGRPALGVAQMYNWRDEAYYRSDPWRGRWDTEGGGVLVNQAPHHLDLLLWLMGRPVDVSGAWANLNHPSIEVDDTAAATIRFESGGLGTIVVSVSQRPGLYSKVHVHGSSGASVGVETDRGATFVAGVNAIAEPPVTDLWTIPGEEDQLSAYQAEDRAAFAAVDANTYYHAAQIEEFLDAVSTGRTPLVTAADGRNVVALFEAIYRSQRERRVIDWSELGEA